MAIADYLAELICLRDALAENLTKMGVAAGAGETLQTLVPKLLKIPVGDTGQEYFSGRILVESFPCTFGFFAYDERAALVGIMDISGLNRIGRASLRFEGVGAELLNAAAEGWTRTVSDGALTLERILPDRTSRFDLQDSLDAITFTATAPVDVWMTLTVTGADSGQSYQAEGAARLKFDLNSWDLLEHTVDTFGAIEAAGYTWEGLENIKKPEGGGQ